FRPLRVDITDRVWPGENSVAVELQSGGFEGPVLTRGETLVDANRRRREWLRKPQFQWGWDWTTRYLNVGISGDAYLEMARAPIVLRRLVPLVEVDPDL